MDIADRGTTLLPGTRYYSSDGPATDGSINEGAFAAFLYDLTDPANESHDAVEYPGSYIADLVRTCTANTRRANGADDLIWCLEQQIDQSAWPYFTTRGDPAVIFSENASEPAWSRPQIGTLWL